MRVLAILSVLFFAAAGALNAQNNDAISKYFDKYMEDERFTAVFISPKMFDMVRKMDIDMELEDDEAEAISEVVDNMESIRILTAEQDGKILYQEAVNLINTKEYEVLMTVHSGGNENVQFLVKDDGGDIVNELLLLVGDGTTDGGEFVMMSFVGDIKLSAIGKLANAFEDDDDDDNDDNENRQQP